ncbi:tumor necrosis factor ligand superfamily member 14-like [Clupea harengus]|uniref:Tumor necrosis factor ligand superfamily member 14-like n=1 Tax=Clupea harengus TaxID=7950 RepID=A0A6P8FYF8_CLUHA|nr:tumor necrosis factor ligand superfamily member 14-like [Clupea harengus]
MATSRTLYNNAFMEDSNTAYPPPLPPKPIRYRKRSVVQPMLFALVALALCGMVVEACFIYRLYSKHPQRGAADGLMLWDDQGENILHEMKYKDGVLTIQQEGYYFVYSKIYFVLTHDISLEHSVIRTSMYYSKEMVLLMSREYQSKSAKNVRTNSYLGGMFHLLKGDTIFVRVNNARVILSTSAENYFGAYMV